VKYQYRKKENIMGSDSNGVRVRALHRHQKGIARGGEFMGFFFLALQLNEGYGLLIHEVF
jgi:hypothetical protein